MLSSSSLLAIFRASPAPCLVLAAHGPHYPIVEVNQAYLKATQATTEALLDQHFLEVLPARPYGPVAQASPPLRASLERVLHTKAAHKMAVYQYSARADETGEETSYWQITNTPIPRTDGEVELIIHTLEEVTESVQPAAKKAAVNLAGPEIEYAHFQALFDESPYAIIALDVAGTITRANASAATIVEGSIADLIGQRFSDFIAPKDLEYVEGNFELALAGEASQYITSARTLTGKELVLQVNKNPIVVGGQPIGVYSIFQNITVPYQAKRRLQEREQRLSTIFATVADNIFVLDRESPDRYKFYFVNREFYGCPQCPADKLIGQYLEEVLPVDLQKNTLARYEEAVHKKQRVDWVETIGQAAHRAIYRVSITPVLDEAGNCRQLVGIAHDFTEQKKAEEALLKSNELFQYAVKATTDAIYDWNIETEAISWGEGFSRLFGYDIDNTTSDITTWAEHLHPEDVEMVTKSVTDALEAGAQQWEHEYRYLKADGTVATVIDLGFIIRDATGQPLRMIGAMQDITKRKEAELSQLKMAQELAAQNTDLQQFTYIVSHNLRAPLANAKGFANLMGQIPRDSPVFDASLLNLNKSLLQLDTILKDINTILSIRDKQTQHHQEEVELAEVSEQAYRSLEALLSKCQGRIRFKVPAGLRVHGNRAYLHSIFHNLISNAIKYRSAERPLEIEVEAAQSPNQSVTIVIADNGLGIDLNKAGQNIFQLYTRFHTNSKQKGRGIGLFLVKNHIESMGGHITVSSQVDVGTRFVIQLT